MGILADTHGQLRLSIHPSLERLPSSTQRGIDLGAGGILHLCDLPRGAPASCPGGHRGHSGIEQFRAGGVRSAEQPRQSERGHAQLPLIMAVTIIVTGNHYVIDAIVGGVLCLACLLPWLLQRRHTLRALQGPQQG